MPGGNIWAIEIKRGLTPKLERGFHNARDDLGPDRSFIVYSGDERYPRAESRCDRAKGDGVTRRRGQAKMTQNGFSGCRAPDEISRQVFRVFSYVSYPYPR
jgi:hypothetical protein